MKKYVLAIGAVALAFSACSKKLPQSYGNFDKHYSCMGVMPFFSETDSGPSSDLLTGYLAIDMYRRNLEVIDAEEIAKAFNEGGVYFPKRFTKALALEYASLLNLDSVIYGRISTPDKTRNPKSSLTLDLEFNLLDVDSARIMWSHYQRVKANPRTYNRVFKEASRRALDSLFKAGFNYTAYEIPCWDVKTAQSLKNLPDLTRETFNSLSFDLAEASDSDMWLHLGNIFMTIGRRDVALGQYQKFLKTNPASPFASEVERQVSVLRKTEK